ncbi:MAG: hypothetical protein ACFCAD_19340 [Pleurocapsa sp.]
MDNKLTFNKAVPFPLEIEVGEPLEPVKTEKKAKKAAIAEEKPVGKKTPKTDEKPEVVSSEK